MISNRKNISDLIKEEFLINSVLNVNLNEYKDIEENVNILNSSNNVDNIFHINECFKLIEAIEKDDIIFNNIKNLGDNYLIELSNELGINYDEINLEISSISENICEDINSINNFSSTKKLLESYSNTNEKEVEEILFKNIQKMTNNIEMFMEEVKFFIEKYSNNKLIKFMTKEENNKKDDLISKMHNSMQKIEMSNSLFKNKDINYFKNRENKYEIIKNYYSIVNNIAIINISMVIFRLLYTKISVDYSITTTLDFVETTNKYFDKCGGIVRQITSNSDKYSGERILDEFIKKEIINHANPYNDFNYMLKYLLINSTDTNSYPSIEFAKRMTLSFEYLHHIDNISKNITDLITTSIGFTKSISNKPSEELFNNFDFENIKTSIAKIKSFIYSIYTDLSSYSLGSNKLIER